MSRSIRLLSLAFLAWTLLMGAECIPPGDDDSAASDDDDATANDDDDVVADDDDATPIGSTTIEGEVIAVDRQSGAILSADDYAARGGGLILYILPDANDLSVIFGKRTMTGPGEYSVTIADYVGPLDVVAVVDEDNNHIIDSRDVARQHAFNPLRAAGGDTTLSDVNVYMDLAPRWTGVGCCGDDSTPCVATELSGDILITTYPDGPVVVTTNSADLSQGAYRGVGLLGAGPWSIAACDSRNAISVLGALDADLNGFWEPSDPWGTAPSNPYVLGLGPVSGLTVTIPSVEPMTPPTPVSYVAITGTVTYDDFLTGNIVVVASSVNTTGQVFSQQTIAAPGPFELVVPGGAEDVLIWAVLDDNSDSVYDVMVDPWDSVGPLSAGTGVSGVDLLLGSDPPAAGTISGTVDYANAVSASDCLTVALFDEEPASSAAAAIDFLGPFTAPTFPASYSFTDVLPGRYWVGGYLDLGCDNTGGPTPSEPSGRLEWPVQLPDGGAIGDVTVTIGD